MTREQARRRRKRRRQIKLMAALAVVYLCEILVALAPAAITATILIPVMYQQRGQFAVGSEWLLITIVFCVAFWKVHNMVCDRIFGEEV